jgi:sugar/nucleoside kinase (ribokinase family)
MQKDNKKNRALASIADILIMNSKYPLRVSEKDSYDEALLEMSTWGPRIVGCTLGEDGSRFVINGKVKSFPCYKVEKVVDTTGCGDVFHGAFLNSYMSGMDLEHCIRFASAAVSIKCNMPGGRAGIPNKEQVLQLLVE